MRKGVGLGARVWVAVWLLFTQVAYAQCQWVFNSDNRAYPLLLAHTPAQQQQGLSGLAHINTGMLFVWSTAEVRHFWMRNTHQPLRLFCLNTQWHIEQEHTMSPLSDHIYACEQPTRYVLELPVSLADEAKLQLGDPVTLVDCVLD